MKKELFVVVFFTIFFYDYNLFGAQIRSAQKRCTIVDFLAPNNPCNKLWTII